MDARHVLALNFRVPETLGQIVMGMEPVKILVYQIGSIGDTVVTVPALKAVRRHFGPDARITLLHEVRADIPVTPADILAGRTEVDEFLGYPVVSWGWGFAAALARLILQIRSNRYLAVVYLAPGERPASRVRRDALFFRACGISRRIGFHAYSDDVLYPARDPNGAPGRVRHEALFRLERLRRDGIDISIESVLSEPFLDFPLSESVRGWLEGARSHPGRPLIAICPGSKQPANKWPLDRFMELGRRLIATGNYELLVVGGAGERPAGEALLKDWGEGVNAAGRFPVPESAMLLGVSTLCIGLDTGTTHLAAAMGIPCVAIYGGREHPGRWEPLGAGHVVLRHQVPCAGCLSRICNTGGHPCMEGIGTEEGWNAVKQKLDETIRESMDKKEERK